MKKIIISIIIVLAFSVVINGTLAGGFTDAGSNANAKEGYGLEETQSAAKLPQGDIPTFLGRFAGAGLALSGSIFLFLIVYGGIIIMTAAGKEDKINKGKTIITWAIIGALILGGSYAITNLVFQAFTDIETPTNVNS